MLRIVSKHCVFLHVVLSNHCKYQCFWLVCFGSWKSYKWRKHCFLRYIFFTFLVDKASQQKQCFLRIHLNTVNSGVLDESCPWYCKNIVNTSGFSSKGTNMPLCKYKVFGCFGHKIFDREQQQQQKKTCAYVSVRCLCLWPRRDIAQSIVCILCASKKVSKACRKFKMKGCRR